MTRATFRPAALALIGLVAVTGCKMDEEAYISQYAEAACELYDDCGYLQSFGGTVESCVQGVEGNTESYVLPSNPDECAFDSQAAKQCVRHIRQSTCDDIGTGGGDANPCDTVCG